MPPKARLKDAELAQALNAVDIPTHYIPDSPTGVASFFDEYDVEESLGYVIKQTAVDQSAVEDKQDALDAAPGPNAVLEQELQQAQDKLALDLHMLEQAKPSMFSFLEPLTSWVNKIRTQRALEQVNLELEAAPRPNIQSTQAIQPKTKEATIGSISEDRKAPIENMLQRTLLIEEMDELEDKLSALKMIFYNIKWEIRWAQQDIDKMQEHASPTEIKKLVDQKQGFVSEYDERNKEIKHMEKELRGIKDEIADLKQDDKIRNLDLPQLETSLEVFQKHAEMKSSLAQGRDSLEHKDDEKKPSSTHHKPS